MEVLQNVGKGWDGEGRGSWWREYTCVNKGSEVLVLGIWIVYTEHLLLLSRVPGFVSFQGGEGGKGCIREKREWGDLTITVKGCNR